MSGLNKTDRELLQQALDALKKHDDKWLECGERVWFEEEIKAIEERLAQPESEPEPFGYFQLDLRLDAWVFNRDNNKGVAFYTAPPKKEWVGLTDDEIEDLWSEPVNFMYSGHYNAIRAIEAKLKDKNAT